MIRVLLVDDQPLVRAGLRRILRPRAGFEVVGECQDGDEVAQAVADTLPDVVVMDVRMKRMDGAEATRRVRLYGGPPVLVLTTFDDDDVLSAALRAGASGFVLKDAPGQDLVRAVRVVAEGGAWLDPGVTSRVLAAFRDERPLAPERQPDGSLTLREVDVLRLVGRGLSNTEVAGALHISEVTVKSHLGHILDKLDLRDRASAIVHAFDSGLVEPAR
ncbi:MAG TPA: response regulator transcription factor [Candidatus Dormibacteraeota bacterium]